MAKNKKPKIWNIIGYTFFGIGMLILLMSFTIGSQVDNITQQMFYILEGSSGILFAILGAILFK